MKRKSLERPSSARNGLRGKCNTLLVTLVALLAGAQACAGGFATDRFTFRGFGTLAATWQDSGEDVAYRRFIGQSRGVADGEVELHTDSIAGAQIDFELREGLSLSAQGVTRLRPDGDWHPGLSQGYLRYSPDESLVLRAGRLGYDIYLLAESRQVGYSYLAMRPSPEIYGMLGSDEVDGADVTYTHRLGRGLARMRLFGGGSSNQVAFVDGTYDDTAADIHGAVLDYLYRGWTARAAIVRFQYDPDPQLALLAAGLEMTGAPGAVGIARGLSRDELTSNGVQLGLVYDEGPLQAQLLTTHITSDSIAGPDLDAVYAQVGYRLGQWTPFLAYASSRDRDAIAATGLPDLPMFAPLNVGVRQVQSNVRSTLHTTSFGLRYDLSSHFDFKLQIDHISIRSSSLMLDRRVPPGGPLDMTVIAAGVDFVF
jgi:hypothetical protein